MQHDMQHDAAFCGIMFWLLNFALPPPSVPLRVEVSIGGSRRGLFEHVVRVPQPPDGDIQPKEAVGWRGCGRTFFGYFLWPFKESN